MKKKAETGIKVQIHHDAQDSRPAAMTSSNQVHNGISELKGVKHFFFYFRKVPITRSLS